MSKGVFCANLKMTDGELKTGQTRLCARSLKKVPCRCFYGRFRNSFHERSRYGHFTPAILIKLKFLNTNALNK